VFFSVFIGEHDPVTIRGRHADLSLTPRPVDRGLKDDGALADKLGVQGIHILHDDVGEVAMVTDFARRQCTGAVADHEPYLTPRQGLPVIPLAPFWPKTQDIN
jgi:hypothetical protein